MRVLHNPMKGTMELEAETRMDRDLCNLLLTHQGVFRWMSGNSRGVVIEVAEFRKAKHRMGALQELQP